MKFNTGARRIIKKLKESHGEQKKPGRKQTSGRLWGKNP